LVLTMSSAKDEKEIAQCHWEVGHWIRLYFFFQKPQRIHGKKLILKPCSIEVEKRDICQCWHWLTKSGGKVSFENLRPKVVASMTSWWLNSHI
jgi:hypothetical protein